MSHPLLDARAAVAAIAAIAVVYYTAIRLADRRYASGYLDGITHKKDTRVLRVVAGPYRRSLTNTANP